VGATFGGVQVAAFASHFDEKALSGMASVTQWAKASLPNARM